MKSSLDIGEVPYEEQCGQVREDGADIERMRHEAIALRDMLRRHFGDEPKNTRLKVSEHLHDVGLCGVSSYYSVECMYDDSSAESVEYAFNCEGNLPRYWDPEAIVYLKEHDVPIDMSIDRSMIWGE